MLSVSATSSVDSPTELADSSVSDISSADSADWADFRPLVEDISQAEMTFCRLKGLMAADLADSAAFEEETTSVEVEANRPLVEESPLLRFVSDSAGLRCF